MSPRSRPLWAPPNRARDRLRKSSRILRFSLRTLSDLHSGARLAVPSKSLSSSKRFTAPLVSTDSIFSAANIVDPANTCRFFLDRQTKSLCAERSLRWKQLATAMLVSASVELDHSVIFNFVLCLTHSLFACVTLQTAVTGLPEPQPDHAVIMVKFAQECKDKMQELLNGLVGSLGADTATLAMRVGCHSGSVTGGVLRGEKSRFQLFGDSVSVNDDGKQRTCLV